MLVCRRLFRRVLVFYARQHPQLARVSLLEERKFMNAFVDKILAICKCKKRKTISLFWFKHLLWTWWLLFPLSFLWLPTSRAHGTHTHTQTCTHTNMSYCRYCAYEFPNSMLHDEFRIFQEAHKHTGHTTCERMKHKSLDDWYSGRSIFECCVRIKSNMHKDWLDRVQWFAPIWTYDTCKMAE